MSDDRLYEILKAATVPPDRDLFPKTPQPFTVRTPTWEEIREDIRRALAMPPTPPQLVIHPREYDWCLERLGLPQGHHLTVDEYYRAMLMDCEPFADDDG